MSILSYDTFWNSIVAMPMTKKMLQLSLKKCPACGRTVLEAALDDYGGKTDRNCEQMQRLVLADHRVLDRIPTSSAWVLSGQKSKNYSQTAMHATRSLTWWSPLSTSASKNPCHLLHRFLVVWDFTHKCNLRCKHCYSNSGARGRGGVNHRASLGSRGPTCRRSRYGAWRSAAANP